MLKDPNWSRWIYTSVVAHFMFHSKKMNINMYLNRYDRDTDWSELRFGGPYIEEPSKGYYIITVNVDILVTCFPGNDQYKMNRIIGTYQSVFDSICVYKYGDGQDDDHSFVGALVLTDNPINITNFGDILPDARFMRSVVETDLRMELH